MTNTILKAGALAAISGFAAISTANATIVDFTDPTTYSVVGSTVTGTGFSSLAASGGTINISEAGPGPVATAPLAGVVDGIGIRDDEVTFPREFLTLTFAYNVTLSTVWFLDLFDTEAVTVSNGIDTVSFHATLPTSEGVGFFTGLTSLVGSVFTFTPQGTNDPDTRAPDFALAGVETSPVPLPAGILLLGGALGGLALARRRKAAAAV